MTHRNILVSDLKTHWYTKIKTCNHYWYHPTPNSTNSILVYNQTISTNIKSEGIVGRITQDNTSKKNQVTLFWPRPRDTATVNQKKSVVHETNPSQNKSHAINIVGYISRKYSEVARCILSNNFQGFGEELIGIQ